MNKATLAALIPITLAALLVSACQPGATRQSNTSPAVAPALSIEALYASPSPIGTEPGAVAWSPDSRKLAFLWNSTGRTFRDIWLADAISGEKTRLTEHAVGVDPALEHRGIGEVVWYGPQQLAYVFDDRLFLVAVNGKTREVETGLLGIHKLATSPDSKQLSFVARSAADETAPHKALGQALWLLDEKAGRAKLLVDPGDADSRVKSYQWASGGSRISFELEHMGDMAKRKIHYYRDGELQVDTVIRAFPGEPNLRFDIGLVDIESLDAKLLQRDDSNSPIWNYGLSDDGNSLFVNQSDPLIKTHRIEVYDVASGRRETFYEEFDPRHLRPDWKVDWAPDDAGLIILTDKDGYLQLYHQRSAADEPRQLTSGNWEIEDFAVADESDTVYFRANKNGVGERQLYRVALTGGEIFRVSDDLSGTHHVTYAPNMSRTATVFSNDDTPPDLYLIDFDTRKTQRVTQSPQAEFYNQHWAKVRYLNFDSHIDGARLIGRLSVPANFDPGKRYPLIVGSVYSDAVRNQWGGRTAHPTWGLDQHLVAQGYILLNVNVRGSWGQGRTHNQGLYHGYGNIDIDDLHSGVRYLIELGYADPERVGIWGSSYGGLMTMMSLFKKPGVYAAGIAGAPATNVWHAYPEQSWVMGAATGDDMPQRYEKQSALFHTDGLEDPLMIIHGSRDPVVLYSDTLAVANKLIARKQAFELVTLPGASHGWDAEMMDQRVFSFKKMVAFFNRHLLRGEE